MKLPGQDLNLDFLDPRDTGILERLLDDKPSGFLVNVTQEQLSIYMKQYKDRKTQELLQFMKEQMGENNLETFIISY